MELKSTPAAFAVLDILGYGNFMNHEPTIVLEVVNELLQVPQNNRLVQRDIDRYSHFSGTASSPKIEYLQFSDTLLIWLCVDPEGPQFLQEPAQLVRSISFATALTLASFISAGIPLRGAVGFGRVYVSRSPLFFTGKELYETVKLEKSQAWAGAALHVSAADVLDQKAVEQFCLEYPIPMSECSTHAASRFAIDWVAPLLSCPELTPPWDRMFCSPESTEVRKQAIETKKFFDAVAPMNRPITLGLSRELVVGIRQRVERLLSKP